MAVTLELAPIPEALTKTTSTPAEPQAATPAASAAPTLVDSVKARIAGGADAAALTQLYLKIRGAKKDIETQSKQKLAPINESLDTLEARLLEMMLANGVDSLKNPNGTPYKAQKVTHTTEDADAFTQFVLKTAVANLAVSDKAKDAVIQAILDSGALAYLEMRPAKTTVEAHLAANNEMVPGIARRVEDTVNVRAA